MILSHLSLILLVSLGFISSPIVNSVRFQDDIPRLEIAHDMVILSKLVYEITSLHDTRIPKGYTPILFEETSEGTEVLIITPNDNRNYMAIIFRGTEEFVDVLTDLEAIGTGFGPPGDVIADAGYVHQGFNEAAFEDDIHIKIERAVKDTLENNPSLDIYYTGHSLGGALASLLGTYMATKIEKKITVINFGSPRIGNEVFRDWARSLNNLAIWRFVNDNDAIARMPVMFFSHVGHLIELEDNEAFLYWQQVGNEMLGYAGAPWWWNLGANPSDHSKDKYVSYISVKSMTDPDVFYVKEFEKK